MFAILTTNVMTMEPAKMMEVAIVILDSLAMTVRVSPFEIENWCLLFAL